MEILSRGNRIEEFPKGNLYGREEFTGYLSKHYKEINLGPKIFFKYYHNLFFLIEMGHEVLEEFRIHGDVDVFRMLNTIGNGPLDGFLHFTIVELSETEPQRVIMKDFFYGGFFSYRKLLNHLTS